MKCDRCDRPIEKDELVCRLEVDLVQGHKHMYHSLSLLCEQCYTTIREVLEDGEIV